MPHLDRFEISQTLGCSEDEAVDTSGAEQFLWLFEQHVRPTHMVPTQHNCHIRGGSSVPSNASVHSDIILVSVVRVIVSQKRNS